MAAFDRWLPWYAARKGRSVQVLFLPCEGRGSLGNSDPGGIPMNANRFWIALPVLGVLGSIALAGYFWNRGPVYGEIAGRVTRGGVPLEQVEVVFYSEDDGPRSWALTDKDGHFEAMTDGIQKVPATKGAPVGKYRVALADRRDQFREMEQMEWFTPAKAWGRDPNRFTLPLEKKNTASGAGGRVPAQYNQLDTPFHDI